MTETELRKQLNLGRISKAERDELVAKLLQNTHLVAPLLDMVFDEDRSHTWHCSWVFDYLMRKNLELLLPHMDTFCSHLGKLRSESVIRPMAHTCELLALAIYKKRTPKFMEQVLPRHGKEITECCFDWLISPHKIAPKVFAMTTLFYFGEDHDWVRPELKLYLEKTYATGSAGYKNRSKKILDALSGLGY